MKRYYKLTILVSFFVIFIVQYVTSVNADSEYSYSDNVELGGWMDCQELRITFNETHIFFIAIVNGSFIESNSSFVRMYVWFDIDRNRSSGSSNYRKASYYNLTGAEKWISFSIYSDGSKPSKSIYTWNESIGRYDSISNPENTEIKINASGNWFSVALPLDLLNLSSGQSFDVLEVALGTYVRDDLDATVTYAYGNNSTIQIDGNPIDWSSIPILYNHTINDVAYPALDLSNIYVTDNSSWVFYRIEANATWLAQNDDYGWYDISFVWNSNDFHTYVDWNPKSQWSYGQSGNYETGEDFWVNSTNVSFDTVFEIGLPFTRMFNFTPGENITHYFQSFNAYVEERFFENESYVVLNSYAPPPPPSGPPVEDPTDPPSPEEIIELAPEDAADIIEDLDVADAASIIEDLEVDDAASIVNELNASESANILESMNTSAAAELLAGLNPIYAIRILDLMDPSNSSQIISEMTMLAGLGLHERAQLVQYLESISLEWNQTAIDAANQYFMNTSYTAETWESFFFNYFEYHPYNDSLENYLGYPVFWWFSEQVHINLQKSLLSPIFQLISDAIEVNPLNFSQALLADPVLIQTVMNSHRFMNNLAKHGVKQETKNTAYNNYTQLISDYPDLFTSNQTFDPEHEPYLATIRAQSWMNIRNLRPINDTNKTEISNLIELSGFHLSIWNNYSVLLIDNNGFNQRQLEVINETLSKIPSDLHDLQYITCNDYLGNTGDKYLWFSTDLGVNVLGIEVGSMQENGFPDEVPDHYSDVFTLVLVHEINHAVDYTQSKDADFSSWKQGLITQAGSNSLNYLRSMFGDGFFVNFPQEFFASISNQWFSNSSNVLQLALSRFDSGYGEPLNQVLFFANTFSLVDNETLFFTLDEVGNLKKTTVYVERTPQGHIRTITDSDSLYAFFYDNEGYVVDYSRSDICVKWTMFLHSGWQLVSIPVDLCAPIEIPVFHQIVAWSGFGYVSVSDDGLVPGKGYWVLVLQDYNITVRGRPVYQMTLNLSAGWNLIGGPLVEVEAPEVFSGFYQLVTWTGTGYTPASTFEPGKGYWALVLEETQIQLPPI